MSGGRKEGQNRAALGQRMSQDMGSRGGWRHRRYGWPQITFTKVGTSARVLILGCSPVFSSCMGGGWRGLSFLEQNHSTAIAQLQPEKPLFICPKLSICIVPHLKGSFHVPVWSLPPSPCAQCTGKPLPENPSRALLWPLQPGLSLQGPSDPHGGGLTSASGKQWPGCSKESPEHYLVFQQGL